MCAHKRARSMREREKGERERGSNIFLGKRIPWELGESEQELDFVKRRRPSACV